MSILDNIIDEHIRLLHSKGYDEATLHSPDRPGKLAYDLRCHLNSSVSEMLVDTTPVDFTLKAIAFFNHNREHCTFELHHQFDAKEAALRLEGLDVVSKGIRLSIPVADSELPHAQEAYGLFKDRTTRKSINQGSKQRR